jgi:hypothetical protein
VSLRACHHLLLRVLLVVYLYGAGCAVPARFPPPPAHLQTVALLPTENLTGEVLLVDGEGVFDRLITRRHVTVGEWVDGYARVVLERRGFTVVAPGGGHPVLRFVIRRWEAHEPDTASVTVTVDARLSGPSHDDVRWQATRAKWRISTLGAPTMGDARARAARSIAEDFLASWSPGLRPSRDGEAAGQ